MKKIKLDASKLKLNKETVGNLIEDEMRSIHGGYTTCCASGQATCWDTATSCCSLWDMSCPTHCCAGTALSDCC